MTFVTLILAATLAAPADALPPQWNAWKFVRAIAAARAGTQTIAVPPSIYASAQPSLADLRVVDENGTPIPFAIATPAPDTPHIWIDAKLTDQGFVRGHYSQVVADLPAGGGEYGALELATPRSNFATRVNVDASDDLKLWRTIRSGAPIYDYSEDGLATNTRVTIPPSTARYLRVRILETARPLPISGVRALRASEQAPASMRYTLRQDAMTRNPAERTSTIELHGIAAVPVNRLRIDTVTPRFARTAEAQFMDDSGTWRTALGATLRRTARGQDELNLDFSETQAAVWRIVVHDGDNAPLQAVTVRAFGIPRRLYFDAQADHRYRLIYGNAAATQATFDYAQTHSEAALRNAIAARLAPPAPNRTFLAGTASWTERNPWVLWAALAIAVGSVGTLALRTIATKPTA